MMTDAGRSEGNEAVIGWCLVTDSGHGDDLAILRLVASGNEFSPGCQATTHVSRAEAVVRQSLPDNEVTRPCREPYAEGAAGEVCARDTTVWPAGQDPPSQL